MSLVSHINRVIVKEITVTARYSAMADLSLYIYLYIRKFLSIYSCCCAFDCILLLCEKDNNNKKRLI